MRDRRPSTSDDPVTEYANLNDFESIATVPSGRLAIYFNEVPVDFYFDDRGFSTTVVAFHGAVMTSVDLPYHIGAGVMENVSANRISISDPSLNFGGDLKLGWFAGSAVQIDLQGFLARVVAKIAAASKTDNLVFFGASGGGFSALEMSRRFAGSLAVAINPQTSISKYWKPAVDRYVGIAWNGRSPFSARPKQLVHDLVTEYRDVPENTVAYIQNKRDTHHVKEHQRPFLEKTKSSGKIWELSGTWGHAKSTGHTPPPKDLTAAILTKVVDANGEWESGLKQAGFVVSK